MGLVVKEQCCFLFMWLHSLAPCQRYKGYVSRTCSLHSFARVHWAGLRAPFSNHSCLVVFLQRAPGSQSTGLLSVSSSPPALESLLPAPVYSALLSKPTACRKKRVSRAHVAVMIRTYLGLLKNQQTGMAVWDAVDPNAHEMSLFQCSGSV